MDKKKNLFWYLAGALALVMLILWVCALVNSSAAAEAEKKKAEENTKKLADSKNKKPKNQSFLDPWNKYKDYFAGQKENVWGTAWDTQKDLFPWPVLTGQHPTDFNVLMRYPAESKTLTLGERKDYQSVYVEQFKDLDKLVVPAFFSASATGTGGMGGPGAGGFVGRGNSGTGTGEENENAFKLLMGPTMGAGGAAGGGAGGGGAGPGGLVEKGGRFLGGGGGFGGGLSGGDSPNVAFDEVLTAGKDPPTPEEMWLLQEDFWVKREMLNIVHAVQQNVARFTPVEIKDDEKKPDGVTAKAITKRFKNSVWELTLYLENEKGKVFISPKSTIKNVSATKAILPVSAGHGTKPLVFFLTQGPKRTSFKVSGETLAYEQAISFQGEPPPVDTITVTEDFGLEQEFDWTNAPIRRIDALKTARQSHRTAKGALKQNDTFKVEDSGAGGAAPGGAPGVCGSLGPLAVPGGAAVGSGGPGGMMMGPVGPEPTPYGLERSRYIWTTGVARHLPIAMVLVVEQTHINDVLIAVANSPFRIQTTQVAFHQVTIPGPREAKTDGEGGPGGFRPMADTARPPRPPKVVRPGAVPMPMAGMGGTNVEELDPNLVELAIYGIATLYRRPKPPEKTDTAAPQPGVPAVPMPVNPMPMNQVPPGIPGIPKPMAK